MLVKTHIPDVASSVYNFMFMVQCAGIGKTYFGGIWCCEALIQGRPLGLEIVISDSDRQLYWVSTKGKDQSTETIGMLAYVVALSEFVPVFCLTHHLSLASLGSGCRNMQGLCIL